MSEPHDAPAADTDRTDPAARPVGPLTRVVIVTEAFPPDFSGGQGGQARDLALGLQRRGHPVVVIARPMAVDDRPARDIVEDVEIRWLGPAGTTRGKGWRAIAPLFVFALNLCRTMPRYRDSVWLLLGVKFLPWPLVPLARLLGARVILKAEAPTEFSEPVSKKSMGALSKRHAGLMLRLLTPLRARLLRQADACIAISDEIRRALLDRGVPPARIAMIGNGIDLFRFAIPSAKRKRELRSELGLPQDGPVMLYCGRLSRAKGLPGLLRAWQGIAPANAPARLVLVGSGRGSFDDCEEELRAFVVAHGLGASVILAGGSDRPEDWLQAADIFVFPSEYEGFGLALIEAMAAGLPVITTPVGIAGEIVEEGRSGALVKIGDERALARAMESLLAAPQCWRAWGLAGRRRVVERFSLETTLDAWDRLIAPCARS